MSNDKYIQEIYQLEIQHISSKFFVDRQFIRGNSKINSKKVLVAETECNFSSHEIFKNEEIVIRKVIEQIRNEYQNYPDIMLYYKIRKEKVWVSQEEDERSYEYVRIVYRDEQGHLLVEERLIDHNSEIYTVISDAMKKIVNEINMLKKEGIMKEKIDGHYDLVIPTSLSGFFIHEIIGHLLEDDFFNHPATIINNEAFCSKILNISDFTTNNININKIDDMGVPCQNVHLIKEGRIINCLSEKTGNKRREDFRHEAITRMRTTYVHPHSNKNRVDYVRGLRNGIYIENITNGNLNPINGSYTLSGYGFLIKNGRKTDIIPTLCIEGNVVEDLKKIVDIGNDVEVRGVECFKKNQFVRVASSSPSILLKDMKVVGDLYV